MNRLLISSLCLGLCLCLTSCPGSIFNKRHGKFQETPVNLEVINSDTDDYNSDLPRNRYGQDYLLFSSKRDRRDKFNLVLKPLALAYDDNTRQLMARIVHSGWGHLAQDEYYYERLIEKANQNYNVLGPVMYTLYEQELTNPSIYEKGKHLLLYADDSKGDLQIKFVHNFNDKTKAEGPFEVNWLNSSKDDAYPTFSSDFSTLYFCSNRDGNFDIFEVAIPTDKKQLLQTLLSDKPLSITKNTQLSSPADDKCPHLPREYPPGGWSSSNDNVMYFVSDRSGGYGGFDIYYSTRENGQWKQPVNMGSRINTTYDEYRPVTLRDQTNFDYHVGIFSSNRPGGKGGFDLYTVGFLKGEEIPWSN